MKAEPPAVSLVCGSLSGVDAYELLYRSVPIPDGLQIVLVLQGPQDANVLARLTNDFHASIILRDKAGLSAARNAGMKIATGKWCIFPDDDCTYEPNALGTIVDALKSQPPAVGIVRFHWVEASRTDLSEYTSPWESARSVSSIELAVRRALAVNAGGFDERFGLGARYGAAEETDLVYRLLSANIRLASLDSIRVHHPQGLERESGFSAMTRARTAYSRARGYGALQVKVGFSFTHVAASAAWFFCNTIRTRRIPPACSIGAFAGRLSGGLSWWTRFRDER